MKHNERIWLEHGLLPKSILIAEQVMPDVLKICEKLKELGSDSYLLEIIVSEAIHQTEILPLLSKKVQDKATWRSPK